MFHGKKNMSDLTLDIASWWHHAAPSAERRFVLSLLATLLVARMVAPPLVVLLPRHLASTSAVLFFWVEKAVGHLKGVHVKRFNLHGKISWCWSAIRDFELLSFGDNAPICSDVLWEQHFLQNWSAINYKVQPCVKYQQNPIDKYMFANHHSKYVVFHILFKQKTETNNQHTVLQTISHKFI